MSDSPDSPDEMPPAQPSTSTSSGVTATGTTAAGSSASPSPSATRWIRPLTFRSQIWNHMKHDATKSKVKCDHCPQIFTFTAGGTSTMARHLEKIHNLTFKDKDKKKEENENRSQPSLLSCVVREKA